MSLYDDDAEVGRESLRLRDYGITILQTHLLAETEEGHVKELLEFFDPPKDAIVLDLGCGIGGVARIMQNLRPDLRFILLNKSQAQLDLCPEGTLKVRGSFEAIPYFYPPPDAVMMQWAIGHGDPWKLFGELKHLMEKGSPFCLYDLCGTSRELEIRLGYRAWSHYDIEQAAYEHGFKLDKVLKPKETFTEHFRGPVMIGEIFDKVFKGVSPVLFRFTKET